MDKIKIDIDTINKCVNSSFDGPDPLMNDSAILKDQRENF